MLCRLEEACSADSLCFRMHQCLWEVSTGNMEYTLADVELSVSVRSLRAIGETWGKGDGGFIKFIEFDVLDRNLKSIIYCWL